MNKILVTDSLFIKDHHVKKLEDAGFTVERLDKPSASEEELCEAVKGKVGYILGGVEKVTDNVISSADELKAIVFTGTGWDGFIPGNVLATKKGIAIGAAPHLNAHAVAEFGMSMSLLMTRDMMNLVRGGPKTFETTKSLSELSIGIVGMGHIAKEYLAMAKGMGAKNISYFNRTRKQDVEKEFGVTYLDKNELFKNCQLIYVAVSIGPGREFISREDIDAMSNGSILVSTSDPLLFNLEALSSRLKKDEIRGAFDENIKEGGFQELPIGIWYTPNESSAFNTGQTVEDVSNSCVETLINLLKTGEDKYLMNPDYKKTLNKHKLG